MKNTFRFTNLYPVSKTLRFKLIPIGKTLEHIKESGILEEDKKRAESYLKVKSIIDDYHKYYIDLMLSDFHFIVNGTGKNNSLEEYYTLYSIRKKNDKERELFQKIQASLRKQITAKLTSDERYKRIFKKELIQHDLLEYIKKYPDSADKESLISEFRNFTVYFTGFNENRKNMYSEEEKSTAISYRIINENLPRFVDNINIFSIISNTEIAKSFDELYKEYESYLQVISINEIFILGNFNVVLTQKHLDVYNSIVGRINQSINLYNQQNKDKRLPKLKILFKQILSDREHLSWLPEEFHNDHELITSINSFYKILSSEILNDNNLKSLIETLGSFDTSGIFIRNDLQLTEISQRLTNSWNTIQNAVKRNIEKEIIRKKKESDEDYKSRIDQSFKACKSFSLSYINKCLVDSGITDKKIEDYFISLGHVDSDYIKKENLFERIKNAFVNAQEILVLNQDNNIEKKFNGDTSAVRKIKDLLDSIRDLLLFVKPLLGNGDEANKDERFYGEFSKLWEILDSVTPLYNKVRNYVTKKPYSKEKIKLNFQNPTLLDGWDLNKEVDNTSVIIRRDGLYYLVIMRKDSKKVFESFPEGNVSSCYEKMEYKLLPGPNKMLPKVFFSKSRIDEFKPDKDLLIKYNKGTHKKGDNFNIKDCHALIDFFKKSLKKHPDWKEFDFKFSETSSYKDISDFYREVENQGYKLSFHNISSEYIDKLVDEGRIFLFQIYNKDFSKNSKGTPNMHTLYWKMLFDERNLANIVYKLNGQAEIFFRKASLKVDKPTHPANLPIKNKRNDSERLLHYDLIKDKRYTIDQFQLHVPITINFKSEGINNINNNVLEYIKSEEDIHVIGIDRGERHLLYLVVSDLKGNICEQFSLNEIVSTYKTSNGKENEFKTNYNDLLERREEERMKARQSWQSIENIKELKEGYLSQVVHKISEMMVKYNAIVILEDLNTGFMRGRQMVEKSVYQKFEKMLIDKLNCLVLKNNDVEQIGGVLHPYQFTNKFEGFTRQSKQNGFLFYIPAWNTSKIDPTTGFVNLFNVKYENINKAKEFWKNFDSICFNRKKNWFEFSFDYNNFDRKAEGTRTDWILCTYGTRIKTFRNKNKNSQWDSEEINLTDEFKKFFINYGIDFKSDLKKEIVNYSEPKREKDFFENLMSLFKITLQMRNSITGKDTDYILSPVSNDNGIFYDSRETKKTMPENADANGAYNIARKGIMLVERIKSSDNLKNINWAISNKEWLVYSQKNVCKGK